MESKFNPKIGQLVIFQMSMAAKEIIVDFSEPQKQDKIGIITNIVSDDSVEVTFLSNDWIITLNPKYLKLLKDVD